MRCLPGFLLLSLFSLGLVGCGGDDTATGDSGDTDSDADTDTDTDTDTDADADADADADTDSDTDTDTSTTALYVGTTTGSMLADGTGKEVASCSGDAQLTAHTRSTGSAEWKFSGEISGTLTCDLGKDIGVIIETTLEGTTPCPDSTSWGDACGTATITAGTETAEANWYGGFGDSGSLDGSMSGAFVYGGVAVTYTQSFEAFKGE